MKRLISKRLFCKLTLDLVMLIVLTLLYNKHSISLTFHEVAGLAFLGVMAIHLALNTNWILQTTRRCFGRGASTRTRIRWIVNALLLVSFAAIGLSGILISRVLFSFGGGGTWKTVHYFASACALILMGIHLGLHAPLLAGLCKKHGLNRRPLRIIGVAAAVVVFVFGCYRIETTSFLQWLSMPFSMAQQLPEATLSADVSAGTTENPNFSGNDAAATAVERSVFAAVQELTADAGQGKHDGSGFHGGGESGKRAGESGSIAGALQTIASFFSIMFVFACLTAIVARLSIPRKKSATPPIQAE